MRATVPAPAGRARCGRGAADLMSGPQAARRAPSGQDPGPRAGRGWAAGSARRGLPFSHLHLRLDTKNKRNKNKAKPQPCHPD